jgi:serine/threonine protein kinase
LPIYSHSSSGNTNNETNDFKVKIGDFGLAMMTTVNKYDLLKSSNNNSLSGSILWMAPEVINQKINDYYSTKSKNK